jgi:hypothetical protein
LTTPSISARTNSSTSAVFVRGDFEEQFVVDLQDHARLELALGELAVDGDHGQLDEVGGGALQRRVDGGALGEAALVGVAALDVGDGRTRPKSVRTLPVLRVSSRVFR